MKFPWFLVKSFFQLNQRLKESFWCGSNKSFAGIPMILCKDLYQLPLIRGKPIYMSNQSIKRYITSDLWETFQFAELIEVMRQDLCGWCWWRCWYRFKRAIRKSKPSIISNKCLFIFLRKQTINSEMGLFERLLWSFHRWVLFW